MKTKKAKKMQETSSDRTDNYLFDGGDVDILRHLGVRSSLDCGDRFIYFGIGFMLGFIFCVGVLVLYCIMES